MREGVGGKRTAEHEYQRGQEAASEGFAGARAAGMNLLQGARAQKQNKSGGLGQQLSSSSLMPSSRGNQLTRRRSDDILLYGDGMFSPLGLPSETSSFSKDWLMESDVVSDKKNSLEMRERRQLKKMVMDQAHHAVLGPPKPLFDFCGASDAMEEFDEEEYYSHSGIQGQRMLRNPMRLAPKAPSVANEPEGEYPSAEDRRVPLQAPLHREVKEVYRCTFQDLPATTPARVIQQLDTSTDPLTSLRPFYTVDGDKDTTLVFESRFESGNLHTAAQVSEFEYELVLRNDTNTRGHTQWYYFRVSNVKKGASYKFNIINLLKNDSLYNQGLRPLMLSTRSMSSGGLGDKTGEGGVEGRGAGGDARGWRRCGRQVRYVANGPARKYGEGFYTLTFVLDAEEDDDTIYLAHCFPYTYRDLHEFLHGIQRLPGARRLMTRRRLCTTEAGNVCEVLTITEPASGGGGGDEEDSRKRVVVITARVHPGETQASWVMQGVIEFLMSDAPEAARLRSMFKFKLVPMLNPDGVINGNYRCCLAGHDMNRRWDKPHPKKHAPIHATRGMLAYVQKTTEVALFLDLHGHSKLKNVFIYGNDAKVLEERFPLTLPLQPLSTAHLPKSERLLPIILSELCPAFSYRQTSFDVQKQKLATGRVVAAREFGIPYSYTLEASFCGSSQTRKHFDQSDFLRFGRDICEAILKRFEMSDEEAACIIERGGARRKEVEGAEGGEGVVEGGGGEGSDSSSSDEGEEGVGQQRQQQRQQHDRSDALAEVAPDGDVESGSPVPDPSQNSRPRPAEASFGANPGDPGPSLGLDGKLVRAITPAEESSSTTKIPGTAAGRETAFPSSLGEAERIGWAHSSGSKSARGAGEAGSIRRRLLMKRSGETAHAAPVETAGVVEEEGRNSAAEGGGRNSAAEGEGRNSAAEGDVERMGDDAAEVKEKEEPEREEEVKRREDVAKEGIKESVKEGVTEEVIEDVAKEGIKESVKEEVVDDGIRRESVKSVARHATKSPSSRLRVDETRFRTLTGPAQAPTSRRGQVSQGCIVSSSLVEGSDNSMHFPAVANSPVGSELGIITAGAEAKTLTSEAKTHMEGAARQAGRGVGNVAASQARGGQSQTSGKTGGSPRKGGAYVRTNATQQAEVTELDSSSQDTCVVRSSVGLLAAGAKTPTVATRNSSLAEFLQIGEHDSSSPGKVYNKNKNTQNKGFRPRAPATTVRRNSKIGPFERTVSNEHLVSEKQYGGRGIETRRTSSSDAKIDIKRRSFDMGGLNLPPRPQQQQQQQQLLHSYDHHVKSAHAPPPEIMWGGRGPANFLPSSLSNWPGSHGNGGFAGQGTPSSRTYLHTPRGDLTTCACVHPFDDDVDAGGAAEVATGEFRSKQQGVWGSHARRMLSVGDRSLDVGRRAIQSTVSSQNAANFRVPPALLLRRSVTKSSVQGNLSGRPKYLP